MASAGSQPGGFKLDTILSIIYTIRANFPEDNLIMLDLVLSYFIFKGINSEGDVDTIDEAELKGMIGREAARSVVEHFRELNKKEKAEEHPKKNMNTASQTDPEAARELRDSAANSGASQHLSAPSSDMENWLKMFLALQKSEGEKNRQLMEVLQTSMKNALEKVTGNIMTTMKNMNDKLTSQIELQWDLLKKMGGRIAAMEQRHQEQAAKTQ